MKVKGKAEDICGFCWRIANRYRYKLTTSALLRMADSPVLSGVCTVIGIGGTIDRVTSDGRGGEVEAKAAGGNVRNTKSEEEIGSDDNPDNEEYYSDEEEEGNAATTGEEETDLTTYKLTTTDAANEEVSRNEDLMLKAAVHVKRADAMREGYQEAVQEARECRRKKLDHSQMCFTVAVDAGQNLELPSLKEEQAGQTYYFSPLTVGGAMLKGQNIFSLVCL